MMKRTLLLCAMVFGTLTSWSQESIVTLSGGYSFANMDDLDATASGYRVNGLFEFNPNQGSVAHGLSIGYINISSPFSVTAAGSTRAGDVSITSWPVYYAPKYIFGEGTLQGFVKGALGWHFSNYSGESTITTPGNPVPNKTTLDVSQSGFYGGVAGGFMVNINEMIFVNAEYEIAYMGNYYYEGQGWMNTAMGGIGIRF